MAPLELCASILDMPISEVACVVDESTIHKWDGVQENWKPPSFQASAGGLQGTLTAALKKRYHEQVERYNNAQAFQYCDPLFLGNWEKVVKAMGEAFRFFRGYWVANPSLSRQAAFNEAQALGSSKIKREDDGRKLIAALLAVRKKEFFNNELQLLLVDVEEIVFSEPFKVFTLRDEGEGYMNLLEEFLNCRLKKNYSKGKKQLIPELRAWYQMEASDEEKEDFRQLPQLRSQSELKAMEKEEHDRLAAEKVEEQRLEAEKKKLEEEEKKLEEERKKQEEAQSASPEQATATPPTPSPTSMPPTSMPMPPTSTTLPTTSTTLPMTSTTLPMSMPPTSTPLTGLSLLVSATMAHPFRKQIEDGETLVFYNELSMEELRSRSYPAVVFPLSADTTNSPPLMHGSYVGKDKTVHYRFVPPGKTWISKALKLQYLIVHYVHLMRLHGITTTAYDTEKIYTFDEESAKAAIAAGYHVKETMGDTLDHFYFGIITWCPDSEIQNFPRYLGSILQLHSGGTSFKDCDIKAASVEVLENFKECDADKLKCVIERIEQLYGPLAKTD